MTEIAQKHKDQLKRIQENVENFYEYFYDNYVSWHRWRKFLYITSVEERERKLLNELGKPEIEFNILEAYVSRQKGEFSKQEPSIEVSGANSGNNVDSQTIDTVEGHIRHIESLSREDNSAYQTYDDMLSGGYSVQKVCTKYADEMSFEQDIIVERYFDPTLCGFDPLARDSHKGDGNFSFENTPFREKEFKEKWPHIDTSRMKFSTDNKKFSWSYRNANEKLIIVCTYYEKEKKRTKIVKLADESVMTEKAYNEFLVDWEFQGKSELPPAKVDERMTDLTIVVRYRFCENELLETKKITDFVYLPHVFFDNNSVTYRDELQSESKQCTRPYCYQAKGIQQLKNTGGQSLTNELEMMIQHKLMVPIEGLPTDEKYLEPYLDVQKSSVLPYNQFYDNKPSGMRLDPPSVIPRQPVPQEISTAFVGADQMTQAILGTYDAALGIQKNELSGVALIEGATQSNATAMPSIVGYISGLNQVAQIILDLIPKYYTMPRSIPIIDKKGNRRYQMINSNGQPQMKFSSRALKVKVRAGVNFTVQKTRALQQVTLLMKVSPLFAQFFSSTPAGIKFILDNIEMKGVDQLKDAVDGFVKEFLKKQQDQKPDPAMIKANIENKRLEMEEQQNEKENQLKLAELSIDDKDADTRRLSALTKIGQNESDKELKQDQLAAENARTAVEQARIAVDQSHRHAKDRVEMHQKSLDKESTIENV